ncbi:sugar ABC transporter substrate-binding protein [Acidocella aminolytica]|jgi:D-xylose transport system substrate-binding protein|uniref:ABC transporter monosaccharide permease n=1 Tax=Acidocella aminolytica 101 = DSM 11237 TaxID=1120923 RepID=A0A0D6PMN7_9PROT|nr:sugar ABC transporter substrate-binding protein [Acidocella aminolytica]GAN82084.1 ABC transporter monosaccharide permease [Acidocella aminolytica 101 = DSM 11237]SHF46917.1 monosaccharide ABC transporter substrate-binding protein, CUT2 family [Acidocella aminolytica 101 = DSM 11237]
MNSKTLYGFTALSLALSAAVPAMAQTVSPPQVSQISTKKVTVAFLLPENSSPRYEQVDRPEFTKMAKMADPNVKLIITNANSNPSTQLNQAQSAITNGADVLVVDPVDGKAGAAIVAYAARNHVPVISYDRLIQDSKPAGYVSFNNTKVGELQGQYIADHVKPGGSIIMINGAPTDPNAFDFRNGALSVLKPLVEAGKLKISYTVMTPNWSPENAFQETQQALTRLNNKVDGVLAANDGTASGAIRALQAVGLAGKVPVTGQDATNGGLTFILEGLQSMTVFKYVPDEAAAAAKFAVSLAATGKVPADLVNAKVNNGKIEVPSVLLTPIVVTAANMKNAVIDSGYASLSSICVGDAKKASLCQK